VADGRQTPGIRAGSESPRDAHSTRMVNARFPARSIYGFEMVDGRTAPTLRAMVAINRKFTPNRMIAIFSEFSATLPQRKNFRFIDGCYSGNKPAGLTATQP
jgi:hypothetical protein